MEARLCISFSLFVIKGKRTLPFPCLPSSSFPSFSFLLIFYFSSERYSCLSFPSFTSFFLYFFLLFALFTFILFYFLTPLLLFLLLPSSYSHPLLPLPFSSFSSPFIPPFPSYLHPLSLTSLPPPLSLTNFLSFLLLPPFPLFHSLLLSLLSLLCLFLPYPLFPPSFPSHLAPSPPPPPSSPPCFSDHLEGLALRGEGGETQVKVVDYL